MFNNLLYKKITLRVENLNNQSLKGKKKVVISSDLMASRVNRVTRNRRCRVRNLLMKNFVIK